MDSYYSNKMSYGEFFGSIMKWMAVALGITTITSFLFSFLHLELILGASYFIFMISTRHTTSYNYKGFIIFIFFL